MKFNIDNALEIIQAFKEGKTIKRYSSNNVFDCYINNKLLPEWEPNFEDYKYEIESQSKYRPYVNAEEFLEASKEHGLIITDNGYYYLPTVYGEYGLTFDGEMTSYKDLLEYFTFAQDGSPCGILEE